jgi:D-galactarolactone cycloisomerase
MCTPCGSSKSEARASAVVVAVQGALVIIAAHRALKDNQFLLRDTMFHYQSATDGAKSARIARVRVIPLVGGTVDGGWPQGHQAQENLHTLVEVHDTDGAVGVGSCFTSGTLVAGACELLWPLLEHESADEPERVSEKLRQSSFWQGRGGSVEHAISGIDIALWDLMGKRCGQPVSRLLGGNYRSRIKPYASILFDEPAALREHLQSVVERGFRAIKMGWRPFGRRDRKFDELLVRTARDTVGSEVELMVDAGGSEQFWPHRLSWARETAHMLAKYDVVWFEEPLAPDDLEGYVELTRMSPVPIAGGEVLTRRQAFLPWLQRRAVDFIQPDTTKNGGLSESRRIAWMADDYHVHFVSHGWNTAIGVAADLQLAAALPIAHYVEYLTPCAYIDNVAHEPFVLDAEGFLEIPSRPGLGITLDEEKLARFCSRECSTFGAP